MKGKLSKIVFSLVLIFGVGLSLVQPSFSHTVPGVGPGLLSATGAPKSANSHTVTARWTWDSSQTVVDVITDAFFSGLGSVNVSPLRRPDDPLCNSGNLAGCPGNLYGPAAEVNYSCSAKSSTATCTFTTDMGWSLEYASQLSQCSNGYHWGLYYHPRKATSPMIDFTPQPGTTCDTNDPPPTPTLIAPANGKNILGNWVSSNPQFRVRVTDPDGDQVRAYIDYAQVTGNPLPPGDQNGSLVASGGESTLTLSPGLVDGKYDWRAKAIDPDGEQSGYTGSWRVKKDSLTPNTPTCSITAPVGNAFTVNMSAATDRVPASGGTPSGIASGRLEKSTNGGVSWSIVKTNVGTATASGEEYGGIAASSHPDTGVSGATLRYRYVVTDGANLSATSAVCSVTIPVAPVPSFSIDCYDCNKTTSAGGVGTAFFRLQPVNNFSSSSVNLSATQLSGPAAITPVVDPNAISLNFPATTPASNSPSIQLRGTFPTAGTYTFRINASSPSPSYTAVPAVATFVVSAPVITPWLNVLNGDVGSFSPIITSGGSKASFILLSTSSNVTFASTKDWFVKGYSALSVDPDIRSNQYLQLKGFYGPTDGGASFDIIPGVHEYNLSPTTSGVKNFIDGIATVFITGNFNIQHNIIANGNNAILFVVNGDVNIAPGVARIDGVFLVGRNFTTNSSKGCSGDTSINDAPLVINGAVYVTNQACFNRSLANNDPSNPANAAETINYEPKYLWLFKEIAGSSKNIFKEVNP